MCLVSTETPIEYMYTWFLHAIHDINVFQWFSSQARYWNKHIPFSIILIGTHKQTKYFIIFTIEFDYIGFYTLIWFFKIFHNSLICVIQFSSQSHGVCTCNLYNILRLHTLQYVSTDSTIHIKNNMLNFNWRMWTSHFKCFQKILVHFVKSCAVK